MLLSALTLLRRRYYRRSRRRRNARAFAVTSEQCFLYSIETVLPQLHGAGKQLGKPRLCGSAGISDRAPGPD